MGLLNKILESKKAEVLDVLKAYDQLEPVNLKFMTGRWKGYGTETGHSLDGMLVPSGWYGKVFISLKKYIHYFFC